MYLVPQINIGLGLIVQQLVPPPPLALDSRTQAVAAVFEGTAAPAVRSRLRVEIVYEIGDILGDKNARRKSHGTSVKKYLRRGNIAERRTKCSRGH